MTEALALLFYLAVLALVVGCFVYLRKHRGEKAGEVIIFATVPLGELATVFQYETAVANWSHQVISLEFTPGEDGPQMIVEPEEVILIGFYPDPLASGRFHRAAAKAGIEPSTDPDDDQYSVTVTGTRTEIARKISQVLQELYQVDAGRTVEVRTVLRWKPKLPARWVSPYTPERFSRWNWVMLMLFLYLLIFRAAVGALCGHPGSGPGRRAVCETLDGLGFGKWRAPWTSFDSLILVTAVGITIFYWKRYLARRKPHGTPGSA